MSLAIAWTPEAKETFDHTVNWIESKWGRKSAEKFVKATHKTINAIAIQPYLFKSSFTQNTRQAFISRQTSMFYEVHTSHILILFFWDNRQEPISD
jgi:plasmid stabilization system protein ParE